MMGGAEAVEGYSPLQFRSAQATVPGKPDQWIFDQRQVNAVYYLMRNLKRGWYLARQE